MRYILPLFFLFVSCSDEAIDSSSDLTQFDGPGLLYVGVTQDYSSSSLLWAKNVDGNWQNRELLTGQSNDFSLIKTNNGFLAVNRGASERNWRRIFQDEQTPDRWTIGTQKSLTGFASGDPSSVLEMNGSWLTANLNEGSMARYFPTDGRKENLDHTELDLGDSQTLRPTSFIQPEDANYTFVIHQGLDQSYQANGSQRIFVMNSDSWQWVDMNLEKDGIQGIKMRGSLPVVFPRPNGRYLLVSICSVYVGEKCDSAIEEFDPNTLAVEQLLNLNDMGWKLLNRIEVVSNEKVVAGVHDKNDFHNRKVIEIPLDGTNVTSVYSYDPNDKSDGLQGFFVDQKGNYFIGHASSEVSGNFSLRRSEEDDQAEIFKTPLVPSLSGYYVD